MSQIERIKKNTLMARETLTDIKKEFKRIKDDYEEFAVGHLIEENLKLERAINAAKTSLVYLETKAGVVQYEIPKKEISFPPSPAADFEEKTKDDPKSEYYPNPFLVPVKIAPETQERLKLKFGAKTTTNSLSSTLKTAAPLAPSTPPQDQKNVVKTTVPAEEEKRVESLESSAVNAASVPEQKTAVSKTATPEKKKAASGQSAPIAEAQIDVGRLDLRVGKVVHVAKHPDADSLYVLKIECGDAGGAPRTVCSGLVKHVPQTELEDRLVVLLCNLKPVKMRGVTSEAMVMCASSPESVEVLLPPEGAKAGALISCTGFARQPDAVLNPKKKIFEQIQPHLHTNGDLKFCYKETDFVVEGLPSDAGVIHAKTLRNTPVK